MNPTPATHEVIDGNMAGLDTLGRWPSPRHRKWNGIAPAMPRPFVIRRYRFLLSLALPLAAVSSFAHSSCAPVFSCTTAKGKQVSVCDAGSDLEYAFGPEGKAPEMLLRLPRSQIVAEHDDGIGRFRHFSVGFAQGDTTYQVYIGFDVLEPDALPLGGVTVVRGTQTLVDMPCSNKKPLVSKLDALDLFDKVPSAMLAH